MEETKTIAYLGGDYSFHHLAAMCAFSGNTHFIPYNSFDAITDAVKTQAVSRGILAISNSIAGYVQGNIERIHNTGLIIEDEIYLKVRLHVVALPGVSFNDISTIHSHPMAFKQAKNFLAKYPHITHIETSSTTEAIKQLREGNLKHSAAIGNIPASEHYKMTILFSDVQDVQENYTRFFVLRTQPFHPIETTISKGKASILMQHDQTLELNLLLEHTGVIVCVSKNIFTGGDTMTYLEIAFTEKQQFIFALLTLQQNTNYIHVFGIYEPGLKYDNY